MAATRYPNNDLRRQVGSPRSKGRGAPPSPSPSPASWRIVAATTDDHIESRDTPCRNVLIYGYCRYKNNGCAFSHDEEKEPTSQPEKLVSSPPSPKCAPQHLRTSTMADPDISTPKTFNVDSPSFTPSSQQQSANMSSKKSTTFSSQAASAAPFTPRGANSQLPHFHQFPATETL